jgi:uncharacterized protein (TIGR00251 family)
VAGPAAWRITGAGLRVRVRLTPRAARDRLEGVAHLPDGPAVKIAVSAPPEDGKANAALCKLLAKTLCTAKSNVSVVAGASGRSKQIEITGDGAALAAVLEAWAKNEETSG